MEGKPKNLPTPLCGESKAYEESRKVPESLLLQNPKEKKKQKRKETNLSFRP